MYTSVLPTPPPREVHSSHRSRRRPASHACPSHDSCTRDPRVAEDPRGISRNLAAKPPSAAVLGGRSLGRDLRRRFEAIRLTINGCVNFAGEINGCAAGWLAEKG